MPRCAKASTPTEDTRAIIFLVGVDEDQVELAAALRGKSRQAFERRAHAHIHASEQTGAFQIATRHLRMFGLNSSETIRPPLGNARAIQMVE